MTILNDVKDIDKGTQQVKIVNLGTTPVWPSGDDAYIIKIVYYQVRNLNLLLNVGLGDPELDIHVDWGDGTSNDYKGDLDYTRRPQHTGYSTGHEYIITITGKFSKMMAGNETWKSSVTEVLSWGSRNIGVKNANEAFNGCKKLLSVPTDYRGFFANTLNVDYLLQSTIIEELPTGIFDKAINLESARNVCYTIPKLKTYQPNLFYANKKLTNVQYAFMGCSALTSRTPIGPDGIELWQRTSANGYIDGIQGQSCFNGCTSMANYSSIPCIGIVCWK